MSTVGSNETKQTWKAGQKGRRSRLLLLIFATLAALALGSGSIVGTADSAQANSACGSYCDDIPADPQALAQILVQFHESGALVTGSTGAGTNEDIYKLEILPIANGNAPAAGCAIDYRIFQLLVITLKRFGTAKVSDISRTCPGIGSANLCTPGSSHCSTPSMPAGRAIDFDKVDGIDVDGGANTVPFLSFIDTFMPPGTNALQWQCGRADSFTNLTHTSYQDPCNHQHVDLSTAGNGTLNLTPTGPSILPGGAVVQVYGTTTGWQQGMTPIVTMSGIISAVYMGSSWPNVFANENGNLVHIWGDSAGWHSVPTGITIGVGSPISAVRVANEPNARVYVNEGGYLMEIYGDSSGWHKGSTGVDIGSGNEISAVYMSGAWGQVMVNSGGTLLQVYGSGNGWVKGNTGKQIGARSHISAVNMGGTSFPQVMVNAQGGSVPDGSLLQVAASGSSWNIGNTGLNIGNGFISAVNMGGAWPTVAVNGSGTLHIVSASTSTGWVRNSTGQPVGPGMVPAVNMKPGSTNQNWPMVITLR